MIIGRETEQVRRIEKLSRCFATRFYSSQNNIIVIKPMRMKLKGQEARMGR